MWGYYQVLPSPKHTAARHRELKLERYAIEQSRLKWVDGWMRKLMNKRKVCSVAYFLNVSMHAFWCLRRLLKALSNASNSKKYPRNNTDGEEKKKTKKQLIVWISEGGFFLKKKLHKLHFHVGTIKYKPNAEHLENYSCLKWVLLFKNHNKSSFFSLSMPQLSQAGGPAGGSHAGRKVNIFTLCSIFMIQ